jgi:hypothetical protein
MSGAIWVLPVCLLLIGIYGMVWIDELSDVKFTINFNMDNNTLEAVKEAGQMQARQIADNECHTIIYEYDYINNTFYKVSDLDFQVEFKGYNNDILKIGDIVYKFEIVCNIFTNYTKPMNYTYWPNFTIKESIK